MSKRRKYNQIPNPFVKLCIDIDIESRLNIMMLLFRPRNISVGTFFPLSVVPAKISFIEMLFTISILHLFVLFHDFHD